MCDFSTISTQECFPCIIAFLLEPCMQVDVTGIKELKTRR